MFYKSRYFLYFFNTAPDFIGYFYRMCRVGRKCIKRDYSDTKKEQPLKTLNYKATIRKPEK